MFCKFLLDTAYNTFSDIHISLSYKAVFTFKLIFLKAVGFFIKI